MRNGRNGDVWPRAVRIALEPYRARYNYSSPYWLTPLHLESMFQGSVKVLDGAVGVPIRRVGTLFNAEQTSDPEAIADVAMYTPRSAVRGSILSAAVHPLLRPLAKFRRYDHNNHWITRAQLARWFPGATAVRRGEVGVMATTSKGTDVEFLHVSQLVNASPILAHLKTIRNVIP